MMLGCCLLGVLFQFSVDSSSLGNRIQMWVQECSVMYSETTTLCEKAPPLDALIVCVIKEMEQKEVGGEDTTCTCVAL